MEKYALGCWKYFDCDCMELISNGNGGLSLDSIQMRTIW